MLHPRVHTPAGKSRFAPASQTHRSLLPAPAPSRPCGSGKVRVVARIRPFLPSEIESNGRQPACVSFSKECTEETMLHIKDFTTSREGSYKVDSCYGEEDEISGIYEKEVEPLLPALFQGNNATVFAYGATGSGKTYTMQGSANHPGLMPLAMSSILAMSEETNFQVAVAYYEVYMDRCYDLLEAKATEISVLEGNDGRIQLRGLSQVLVRNISEFREVFVNGCLRRRVGLTGLNDVSSRSHGVLMVTLTSADECTICGKLNLIDLAGNEDNRRTGNEGVRLAESARINQDLFALSNVISALSSNESRVPYRDSKLTRILQDSLGGTSQAIMIVCLNPRSYQEAAHTLIIAARTRQILSQTAEKKENSSLKMDMGAKLRVWLEAKGKISSVSPSPGKPKPLFFTPSHHEMNQVRRMARNLPPDTPKARRILVLHQPNCGHEKDKERMGTQASSQQTKLQNTFGKEVVPTTSMKSAIPSSDQTDQITNVSDSGRIKLTEELCSNGGLEANKENLCNVLDLTPYLKVHSKSSSPPLSERLHKLRAAMKEILYPTSDSIPTPIHPLPEHQPPAYGLVGCTSSVVADMNLAQVYVSGISTCGFADCLSPGLTQVNSSPLKSPIKTPLPLSRIENESNGTALEKLSKKSSGMKNCMTRELLEFFNTASRDELLELKGIGEKRAAYILSLRENSPEPLKEIEDLEKIGISKKQAQSLFKHTARHLLFA